MRPRRIARFPLSDSPPNVRVRRAHTRRDRSARPAALAEFAREVAPHIDRLAIAVHRHASPAGRAVIRSYGLPNAGVLIDVRALLLGGPITFDDLATIERYAPRDGLQTALDEHVRQGMLAHVSNRYRLTARGRELLERLTVIQGETITILWADSTAGLPMLIDATTRVIAAATSLPRERYPAFTLMHAAPDPPAATAAHRVLTRLTTLRYLRADAHAAAWSDRGLIAPHAEPHERELIEADTNANAAPPWAALARGERERVLAAMAALIG